MTKKRKQLIGIQIMMLAGFVLLALAFTGIDHINCISTYTPFEHGWSLVAAVALYTAGQGVFLFLTAEDGPKKKKPLPTAKASYSNLYD